MTWKTIYSAPKDGSPIWAKGFNFGQKDAGEHRCWAWWNGDNWIDAASDSNLFYLVEWMPLPERQK